MVLTSILKRSENVSDYEAGFVSRLASVISPTQKLGPVYLLLTNFIAKGTAQIPTQPAILKVIIQIAANTMFIQLKRKHCDAARSEGTLLLHQILVTFRGLIDDELRGIVDAVIRRIYEPTVYTQFFRVRLLSALLAAFYYNVQMTFEILASMKWDVA
jgi:hypothetical protein